MDKGFTLIELVVVLVILALISIITFSSITPLDSIRLNLAGQQIQSDIRYAQSLAVSIQRPVRISFSSGSDNYTVSFESTPGSGVWTTAKKYLSQDNFTVQLKSGTFAGIDITSVSFNGAETPLVFNKWGNPCAGNVSTPLTSTGRVRLNNALDILVGVATGRVIIQNV